jgi:hypothetical protein
MSYNLHTYFFPIHHSLISSFLNIILSECFFLYSLINLLRAFCSSLDKGLLLMMKSIPSGSLINVIIYFYKLFQVSKSISLPTISFTSFSIILNCGTEYSSFEGMLICNYYELRIDVLSLNRDL